MEIEKITLEKEECNRQVKISQDNEKALQEKVGEADYLKRLLEKQLDITYPDMSQSQISMRQSGMTNSLDTMKNVHAVMDPEQ